MFVYVLKRAWLIGGRTKVKARLRNCIVCAWYNSRPVNQIMAPQVVVPSRPFSKPGVNFAGPFSGLRSKGRGTASSKGYVVVFVCMSTKALLIVRRGKPTNLYSDNATNFRGADLEQHRLLREAEMDQNLVAGSLVTDGINWHFIPSSAPHFGGLWQADVKSIMSHLRRVIGPQKLTSEAFLTLLVEIQMILNSRPIGPLSGESDDVEASTPAHLLIGSVLVSIPQPFLINSNLDSLTHWSQLVKGIRDLFWTRWSREYLNTLQQQCKWVRSRESLSEGDNGTYSLSIHLS